MKFQAVSVKKKHIDTFTAHASDAMEEQLTEKQVSLTLVRNT